MPTTPTGNFALTLYNLATLVASSATFRATVAAADVAAARAYVYWLGDTAPADTTPAYAAIRLQEGWQASMEQSGGGAHWHTMPLRLFFQRRDDANDDATERQIKFWNWIGAVVAEMEALSKTAGYLYVTSFRLSGHKLSDPTEQGAVYQQCTFDVQVN